MHHIDKIVCVGKNYLDHAAELGDAIPEKPVLFLKPASVLKQAQHWGKTIQAKLPNAQDEIHYECEVVLRLGKDLQIDAVTLGLDMTNRSLQAKLKQSGHPWTIGKVFVDSAIIGPWIPAAEFPHYLTEPFRFELNGTLCQQAKLTDAIMQPQEVLEYISSFFPICSGDLIFTGTPVGVGRIRVGDVGCLTWVNHQYQIIWT